MTASLLTKVSEVDVRPLVQTDDDAGQPVQSLGLSKFTPKLTCRAVDVSHMQKYRFGQNALVSQHDFIFSGAPDITLNDAIISEGMVWRARSLHDAGNLGRLLFVTCEQQPQIELVPP